MATLESIFHQFAQDYSIASYLEESQERERRRLQMALSRVEADLDDACNQFTDFADLYASCKGSLHQFHNDSRNSAAIITELQVLARDFFADREQSLITSNTISGQIEQAKADIASSQFDEAVLKAELDVLYDEITHERKHQTRLSEQHEAKEASVQHYMGHVQAACSRTAGGKSFMAAQAAIKAEMEEQASLKQRIASYDREIAQLQGRLTCGSDEQLTGLKKTLLDLKTKYNKLTA
ncbi:Chromosome partition protein Smc [Carpediemonas membranifera]|uniref:Chromosome partition protein Smc n=1 Tax=Carpediemonas membranifera TaxID=201153 RepID=A0A8J6AVK6_9EUKA|nr:Chromosome partition protein Smc [Carpediemonas membranifera]|eukprot:KAG9395881.1 Chromosome partition protein Smc [Carpediemonas membranifera]